MNRLWLSSAILFLLFIASFTNTWYMKKLSHDLSEYLKKAEESVTEDNTEQAVREIDCAMKIWNGHDEYLHMVMHHDDIDEIILAFHEVRQLAAHRENGGEFSAANARLIHRIGFIYETEQFNLKNLL